VEHRAPSPGVRRLFRQSWCTAHELLRLVSRTFLSQRMSFGTTTLMKKKTSRNVIPVGLLAGDADAQTHDTPARLAG